MSMICSVLGVSPAQIAALKATPALASYLAMHADEAALGASVAPGLLAALGPIGAVLDLHKSWHILHYLFSGHVGPTTFPADALMSGEELGEDMGYGPPRLHDANATGAFAEFLKPLTLETLDARIDLAAMQRAGVYATPMGARASKRDEAELHSEIAAYFEPLRGYVVQMAEMRNGLLVWLS